MAIMSSKGSIKGVRFDEGGLDGCLWVTLNWREAGNGGYNQGLA